MAEWPLFGRDEERTFVSESLRDSGQRGVLLSGESGVGKSRLAREALDEAKARGERVEWIVASESLRSLPFGAVAHLAATSGAGAVGTDADVYMRVAAAVVASDNTPLVIGIDDAHWLDPGSAAVISHLVVSGGAKAVLTVARGQTAPPDAIINLWKDGYVQRLELQPLGRLDADQLVREVLRDEVDETVLQRLWELTVGNLLYLHEVVHEALEKRLLRLEDGLWRCAEPLLPASRVQDLLESRFSRLAPGELEALEFVAFGEPLSLDTLLARRNAADVGNVERLGFLVVEPTADGDVARCAHPLYREVLRVRCGAVRQRAIAAELFESIVASRTTAIDKMRAASFCFDADVRDRPDILVDGALTANRLSDFPLAEKLARRAIETGERGVAKVVLADALNHQGRFSEAQQVLVDLDDDVAANDFARAHVAVTRYFHQTATDGFRREFEATLLTAERECNDPRVIAFLQAQRANLLAFGGHFDDALALAGKIADPKLIAAQPELELAALRAVSPVGTVWTLDGRPELAVSLCRAFLPIALTAAPRFPQALFWVASTLAHALTLGGHLDEAEELLASAGDAPSSGSTDEQTRSFVVGVQGLVDVLRGRVQRAQRRLTAPSVLGVATAAGAAGSVEAFALTRDAKGAARALAIGELEIARAGALEGLLRRSRTWAAVAKGDLQGAAALAFDAAEWSERQGHLTALVFSLHDAIRLGRAARATPLLRAHERDVNIAWYDPFLAHGEALVAGDAAVLEDVASAFEARGAQLFAAEAAAEAARTHSENGLTARAQRCAARATLLLGECEGAQPLTHAFATNSTSLTRREYEVAALAAQQLSSSEIAERLVVSRRTVEGHLLRIYGKLGINNRAQLEKIFGKLSD